VEILQPFGQVPLYSLKGVLYVAEGGLWWIVEFALYPILQVVGDAMIVYR
jgi:hypothetical protein